MQESYMIFCLESIADNTIVLSVCKISNSLIQVGYRIAIGLFVLQHQTNRARLHIGNALAFKMTEIKLCKVFFSVNHLIIHAEYSIGIVGCIFTIRRINQHTHVVLSTNNTWRHFVPMVWRESVRNAQTHQQFLGELHIVTSRQTLTVYILQRGITCIHTHYQRAVLAETKLDSQWAYDRFIIKRRNEFANTVFTRNQHYSQRNGYNPHTFDNEPFSLHEAYSGLKLSLPTPQTGHTQSSGISSKAVPGAMPPSGSPSAGS